MSIELNPTQWTTETFDRLPLLLRRNQVLEITGLETRALTRLERSGELVPTVLPGMKAKRWRREDLRKLVGL